MGSFIIILGYILLICEVLWYFTCTKHEDVPLILVLIAIIFGLIPVVNIALSLVYLAILRMLEVEDLIELKNNWFNRKFLAYHE